MHTYAGTRRNYRVVGLTPRNTVTTQADGKPPDDSGETPSEAMVPWLTPREKAILRRGLTRGGKDRRRPCGIK